MYRLLLINRCLYCPNVVDLLTINSLENCISRLRFDATDFLIYCIFLVHLMLHIDLTTISYSDNFKLDSSVLRNGANLSSFTSRSDINVCWLPVSNKILTTQIYCISVTLH